MKSLHRLNKAENSKQYAELANKGLMLGYPVKINGVDKRPDNNIGYHSTIKYFDPESDHPHAVHGIAQHLPLNPPDAKNTQIGFDVFKDRMGNDVHTIVLSGNSAEKLKEHNGKFAGMGFPSNFEWKPHISVDKATHDKIKASGAKTVHEAGIEFGPAQLRKGPTVLKTYHKEPDTTEPKFPDQGDMTAKVGKAEEVLGQKPLMKPYVSEAQRRWAHTPSGEKALGGKAGVHHWDEATKGKKLPEKVTKSESWSTKPYVRGLNSHHFEQQGHKIAIVPLNQGGHRVTLTTPKGEQHIVDVTGPIHHAKGHAMAMLERHTGINKSDNLELILKNLIKSDKDLFSLYGKVLGLTGEFLKNYIEDNKLLKEIVDNL